METMRAKVPLSARLVTRTVTGATVLSEPPYTRAPAPLSWGTDSPVTGASSKLESPATSVPSRGTRSPGSTRTSQPTSTSARGSSATEPSARTTWAVSGASSMRPSTEPRLRRMDQPSSHSPTWSRKMTMAASRKVSTSRWPPRASTRPMTSAPTTAMDMSTFMSAFRRPRDAAASGRMNARPARAAAA